MSEQCATLVAPLVDGKGANVSTMSAGEAIVHALYRAGVTRVFGVPGESFMGVLDALYDTPVDFVSSRHEGGAAFMASGYAKISGEVGVCMGTRGVGSSNMAIGIHTAKHDSTPMIAMAGQVNRGFRGRDAFQELDLVGVFAHYCKWAYEIDDGSRVPEMMERAMYVARSGRPGPVFLSLPEDMLRDVVEASFPDRPLPAPPAPLPATLDAILDRLLTAERPAILAGGGVLMSPGAHELLVRFAERVEIPVFTAWRRHDAFPNDHRLHLGSASLGQPPIVWTRLAACDVLLAIGTRFQEITTQGYRVPSASTQVLHIDIEPASINVGIPATIAVTANAAVALKGLLERLPDPVPGRDRRRDRNVVDRAAFAAATTPEPGVGREGTVDITATMKILNETVPKDAIISTDAGNFYGWMSRYYRFRHPNTYVGPTSGAMGYGLPAAIGAKLARPDVPVICLAGDGGFMMTMPELETAVRLKTPVISIVFDNQLYGTIRMHQERDHPGRVVGTELTTPDLARTAESFGAVGLTVTAGNQFADALRSALELNRPSVIHVLTDPERISVGDTLTDLGRRNG